MKESKDEIEDRNLVNKTYDAISNELKEGEKLEVNMKRTKARPKLAPNAMVFQTMAYLVSTQCSTRACQVFMYFLGLSGYENFVSVDQSKIASELKTTERTVQDAIKELVSHGVVVTSKYENDKRRLEYYINPIAAWRGNSLTRKIKVQSGDENQLEIFGKSAKHHLERETEEIKKKKSSVPALQMLHEMIKKEKELEE